MNNLNSPDFQRSGNKRILDRVVERSLRLLVVFGISSTFLFLFWLNVALIWPTLDTKRVRQEIPLLDNRNLVVDYPLRLLAEDQSSPMYLTVDGKEPVSIALKLPSTAPVILTNAVPTSSVKIGQISSDQIIVTWPFTGTADSHPPSRQGVSTMPLVGFPNTVTLYFQNGYTKRVSQVWPWPSGFETANLTIVNAGNRGRLAVAVETTARAQLRSFADEYSFVVILPFLIAAAGFLRKIYLERQSTKQKNAEESLNELRRAIINGNGEAIKHYSKLVETYSTFLASDELERIRAIVHLSKGAIPRTGIATAEFSKWSDSWASALEMAANAIQKSQSAQSVVKGKHNPSDQPSNRSSQDANGEHRPDDEFETAATSQRQTIPDTTIPDTIKEQTLRSYIRAFPRDLLTLDAEKRFYELTNRTDIQLVPTQRHQWPIYPECVQDYKKLDPNQGQSFTIRDLGLFPAYDAKNDAEQRYLFSTATEWFWNEHQLYTDLCQTCQPTLVSGEVGAGRTALALALTKYADRDSETVLAAYFTAPVTRADIQLGLARSLLAFVQWRSTWLMKLTPEERNLLASLFLKALDPVYVLAQLNQPLPEQFEKSLVGSSENKQGKPSEGDQILWKEQAVTEFRLLRKAIEQMAATAPIPADQWPLGLNHCTKQLGFDHVRIAVDLSAGVWNDWQKSSLPRTLHLFQKDSECTWQFLVLVADDKQKLELPRGMSTRELNWHSALGTESQLKRMLRHRFVQRGVHDDVFYSKMPAIETLISVANDNPRRLARLWQHIEQHHPGATELTEDYVQEAKAALS